MAENLQFLKRRIKTSSNIAQIAKAMEMISASKIKRAQQAVENNRPYSQRISSILEKAISSIEEDKFRHPYIQRNTSSKKLYIVIAPDKGLAGSLPTNLTKKMSEINDADNYIVTIGKKIEKYAGRLNSKLLASFPMGTALPKYSTVFPLINLINQYYLNNEISEVYILLTEFKSIFTQEPGFKKLLPIEINYSDNNLINEDIYYKFEPDLHTILEELLPYYLEVKLYHYLIEAFTAEQAARMVAMQNAKNNALDIAEFLTLSYNKARQAKITNELLDLANIQFT